MPRIAAGALFNASILLVATLACAISDFVCGWLFAIEPMLLELVLFGGLLVGLFGTIGYTLMLIVSTLRRRAHWRYLVVPVVLLALWFVQWGRLPPAYLAGMSATLWYHGVTDDALVAFAKASRAENVPANAPGRRDISPSLRAANAQVGKLIPSYARLSSTPEAVDIVWGGVMVGARGIRILDGQARDETSVSEPAIRLRVSPLAYVYLLWP